MKTALFVDFDNIYIALKRNEPRAARIFASDPGRWLRWIELGMPVEGDEARPPEPRSVLVRKCYLNPRSFQDYRPYFVRSAFDVVDCPPLTLQGKTSTDIRMVMDILDALEHKTRFDEFIILSGDADFTPVLLRLRGHDRRTSVLAIGYAAEAYKAACDRVIDEDAFIESGLGLEATSAPPSQPAPASAKEGPALAYEAASASEMLLDRIAAEVLREAGPAGALAAADLPRIYRRFPEFANSNWLGYRSLRALTEAVVVRQPELRITEGDEWSVLARAATPRPGQPGADEIVELVRGLVAASQEPVGLAWAAQKVIDELGKSVIESRWAGAGTFKALLLSTADLGFEIDTSRSPGYLRDPQRHAPPEPRPALRPALSNVPEDLLDLVRRVHQVTGVPALAPLEYAALFAAAAAHLGEHPFHLYQASRPIAVRLRAGGHAIPEKSVTFVLRGIMYGGLALSDAPHAWAPAALAQAFHKNVDRLCEGEGLSLTPQEQELLRSWLVAPGSAAPPEQTGRGEQAAAEPGGGALAGDGG